MNIFSSRWGKRKLFINIFLLIGSLLTVHILIGYTIIYRSFISQRREYSERIVDRVKHDIAFENGMWNMNQYLSDPLTPHPNGSSGFQSPLYIITDEGFVIERNAPISGFLDSSDYQHLLQYVTPQYVHGVTNEQWRILSEPIHYGSESVGVITASVYNIDVSEEKNIDKRLQETISIIKTKLKISDSTIDVTAVDVRTIPYDISFEVVNKFNKVLLNNGRTPSFIDRSYVYELLNQKERIVENTLTGEMFLVRISELIDELGGTKGVVVGATSLLEFKQILNAYLLYSTLFSLCLLFPLSHAISRLFFRWIDQYSVQKEEENELNRTMLPSFLSFNKKESILDVDGNRINIPFASNQYYLCDALFSSPKKRWEHDELLEKMGESTKSVNARKIYDAALALNKKFHWKLVDYQDKTYRLNPSLVSRIR